MSPQSPASASSGGRILVAAAGRGSGLGGLTSTSPAPQTPALLPEAALSLQKRIERLPEPERSERRALFSDEEWNSWTLVGQPWQQEPQDPNWKYWSIQAPRGAGKTYAGVQWAVSLLLEDNPFHPNKVGAMFQTAAMVETAFNMTLGVLEQAVLQPHIEVMHDNISAVRAIRNRNTGSQIIYTRAFNIREWSGANMTHMWADEIVSQPKEWFTLIPTVKKFLFTGGKPFLPVSGYLSRPGLPRV